ncbi:hypothetical protein D9M71_610000 [compost metagenome]
MAQQAARQRQEVRWRRQTRLIGQALVVVAEDSGEILLAAGVDHRQGVGELIYRRPALQALGHDRREHLDDLRWRTELRHGVERGSEHMHDVPHVHADLARVGQDHGAVTVTDTVSVTPATTLDAAVMLAVPTASAVTSPVIWFTEAILGALEVQRRPCGAPAGRTTASKSKTWPTAMLRASGATSTEVGSGPSASGVSSTIRPKSEAVAEAE